VDAGERITDLARAILEGRPVDWRAVESTADDERAFDPGGIATSRDSCGLPSRAARHSRTGSEHEDVGPPPCPRADWQWRIWTGVPRLGSTSRSRSRTEAPPADSDAGDARASSIIHEGRLLARVRHPNIVTIYGAERIGDTVGLWMERVGWRDGRAAAITTIAAGAVGRN
jgi:hypothetical protein